MITPDDPHHRALEAEIVAHACAHGWKVGSGTYHDVMPIEVQRELARCWDPAALYVRGRADRVAVKDQCCILFEAKTNSGRHQRAAIEALPLLFYRRLGIRCLYVYRDVKDGYEAAFWTTAAPTIEAIFFSRRRDRRLNDWHAREFATMWPDADIVKVRGTDGSNDPYVVIPRDALDAVIVPWRTVFAAPPATVDDAALDAEILAMDTAAVVRRDRQ